MKKMMMTLAMMMVMTVTANAMSYNVARNEARFLSDKMAYELNLSDAQYNAVYEINLDYLLSIDSRGDVRGRWWDRRNSDLKYVLSPRQYERYVRLNHFYAPVSWRDGAWAFNVYTVYGNRHHYYRGHPTGFADYRGGNNRRDARFYADWNAGHRPAGVSSKATWRITAQHPAAHHTGNKHGKRGKRGGRR